MHIDFFLRFVTNRDNRLNIDGNSLTKVNVFNYLGIRLDQKLNFSEDYTRTSWKQQI